jgi:predicted dinucleotide-binding enzyme
MARELGRGWIRAGHSVTLGSRRPSEISHDIAEIRGLRVADFASAISGAEVVVIATPYPAVVPFVEEYREMLLGTVLVDISNPFDNLPSNELAGAEYTARALGTANGLVAAFKDNFAATVNAAYPADSDRGDVKIAGDDEAAKAVVAALARDLGHRPLDCGPLHNARLLDGMVTLMLDLDRRHADFTMETGWRFVGLTNG